jgi:hypothetical protein
MGWYVGMTPEQMKAEFEGASCSIDQSKKSSSTSTTPDNLKTSSEDKLTTAAASSNGGNTACLLPPSSPPPPPPPDVRYIYHLCQKSKWETAVERNEPYFPPTYMVDGKFTRASVNKDDILDVANEYYRSTPGDFCLLEIDCKLLYAFGIPIMAQDAPESTSKKVVKCLQIFGGISTASPNLVPKVYRLLRKTSDGTFVTIMEPTCASKAKGDGKPAAINVADVDKTKSAASFKNERKPEQAKNMIDASNTKQKGLFGRMRKNIT